MSAKKDILNLEDIKLLVDAFYNRVREDELLAPVFNSVIQDNWSMHLEKMYKFWQTVLLSEHTYYGTPFAPHAKLPVEGRHFDQWLKLFFQTIDETFEGEKASEAKWRGEKMAEMFQIKLQHYRNSKMKPII